MLVRRSNRAMEKLIADGRLVSRLGQTGYWNGLFSVPQKMNALSRQVKQTIVLNEKVILRRLPSRTRLVRCHQLNPASLRNEAPLPAAGSLQRDLLSALPVRTLKSIVPGIQSTSSSRLSRKLVTLALEYSAQSSALDPNLDRLVMEVARIEGPLLGRRLIRVVTSALGKAVIQRDDESSHVLANYVYAIIDDGLLKRDGFAKQTFMGFGDTLTETTPVQIRTPWCPLITEIPLNELHRLLKRYKSQHSLRQSAAIENVQSFYQAEKLSKIPYS